MTLPEKPTTDTFVRDQIRTRVSQFINKAACKQYLMDYADQTRHHKWTRIDSEIFDELNAVLRKHMRSIVTRNPSFGKTLR
jgi:hypothetical protein